MLGQKLTEPVHQTAGMRYLQCARERSHAGASLVSMLFSGMSVMTDLDTKTLAGRCS
jgi:hypothetical protein